MKKHISAMALATLCSMSATAQTLNVEVGQVVYQIPAAQAGEMVYKNGETVTIIDKEYHLSEVGQMYVDQAEVADNSVSVVYSGTEAKVYVAGNIARYVTPTVSGAHVSIEQSADVDDSVGEITYTLSGTSADGEFYMTGSYKATVALNGLTLTNQTPVYSGAAICIMNGKRIDLSVKKDTENTLTDAATGSQKAALYCKGHLELKGQGTLNVYGKLAHAIKSAEYMQMRKCTVNVLEAVKDGLSCDEYLLIESGTLNISGVGDDGIQCDLDGTTTTGQTTDHEDEDTGNIYLQGGTITIATTAVGAKGIKARGDIVVSEASSANVITITTSGGVDASDSSDLTASACMKADGNITVGAGTLTLTNTGQGGRALNSDGAMTFAGGTVTARAEGSNYGSSSGGGWGGGWGGGSSSGNHKYAKGIKADGNITISDGIITAYSKNHEGLESKGTITISGGQFYAQASDDAINAASHLTISGGMVCGYSTGNDGIDANGNMYLQGGTVYAICSGSPEVALDANTEGGYKLYVQGGTLVAIGGIENGSSLTQSCYQASSWNRNTWYALYNGNDLALAFKTPASGGSGIVVSTSGTPTMKSGVSVSGGTSVFGGMATTGATVSGGSSVSVSSYSGGNSGPGGGGPGGGGPGGGPGGRW